jgi:hypothetical protein
MPEEHPFRSDGQFPALQAAVELNGVQLISEGVNILGNPIGTADFSKRCWAEYPRG